MKSCRQKGTTDLWSAFVGILVLLFVSLPWPALSQDFDVGLRAAQSGDFDTAFSEWQPLAASGSMLAQYYLGVMYENGDGVPIDLEEARRLYLSAANQGLDVAQDRVATMYEIGIGGHQDSREALSWYKKAGEQGLAGSQNSAGVMLEQGLGTEANAIEAAKWYRLAAEQGLDIAQFNLGVLFANGEGVEQDWSEAAAWYLLAAEQGFGPAQFNLGNLYLRGHGVEADDSAAATWFMRAAQQGRPNAQYNLALMYETGRGVAQDFKKAAEWYRNSGDQGFPEAQYSLGLLYEQGNGVEMDAEIALSWFKIAADQGHEGAKTRLAGRMVDADLDAPQSGWISLALSMLFLVVPFGAMYVGVRTSKWDVLRRTYWFGLIGLLVASRLGDAAVNEGLSQVQSPAVVLASFGALLLLMTALMFFWGRLCAGRAINAGRNRQWAWITLLPIVGWLWLGFLPPKNNFT